MILNNSNAALNIKNRINDLIGEFGTTTGKIDASVDGLSKAPLGVLKGLHDAFDAASLPPVTAGLAHKLMPHHVLPSFGPCLPPHMALEHNKPKCGHSYFERRDLAAGAGSDPFSKLFNPLRRAAMQLERALTENPFLRKAFEHAVGGKFIPDRSIDGKITIKRHHHGCDMPRLTQCGPLAPNVLGLLQGLDQAVLSQAGNIAGLAASPFDNMLAGGLGNALSGKGPKADQANSEVANIMADPSLTVEDKITMMLMAIMKRADKEIEEQAKKIDAMQNTGSTANAAQPAGQGGKGGGGKGGLLGSNASNASNASGSQGTSGESKSVDVEMTKLKRLQDKRGQMFDMLRQIIDKYNQTASGIIQSIGSR